jgi:glycosyltransferase involved in cell wall biosynthesis
VPAGQERKDGIKSMNLCLVSQWRLQDLERIPGKPISEAIRFAEIFDKVIFVCYNEEGKFLAKRFPNNLFVYTVPLKMSSSLSRTLKAILTNLIRMALLLWHLVKLHNIDLIRSENIVLGGIPTAICSLFAKVKYGIWLAGAEDEVITMRYDSLPARIIAEIVLKAAAIIVLARPEFVISVSHQLLEKFKGLSRSPMYWTPNFVDLQKFESKFLEKCAGRVIRFLYVGRLEVEKGIEVLVTALKKLATEPNYEVLIAGWGSLQDDILRLKEQGMPVRHLGKKSHDEMPDIYVKAHVVILPSLSEGMPAALLEGMAMGLPVIATSVGEIPNIVRNEIDGFIISPGSVKELVENMARFLRKPSLIRKMGKSARLRVTKVSGNYIPTHASFYRSFVQENQGVD